MMRGRRHASLAVLLGIVGLDACASEAPEEDAAQNPASSPDQKVPSSDGGQGDAATSNAARSCEDCRVYPEQCSQETFCQVSLSLETHDLLFAVAGRSSQDVWTAGSLGLLLHYDGTSWTRQESPGGENFTALFVSEETWLGGTLYSSFVRGSLPDGGPPSWTQVVAHPGLTKTGIRAIWAGANSTWTWVALEHGLPDASTLARVRRDGSNLQGEMVPAADPPYLALTALDGLSKSEVWVVGERGTASRVTAADGERPLVTRTNTQTENTLNGIAVVSDDDIWAVGHTGTIRRYHGNGPWERIDSPTTNTLRAVKAVAPDDVWAVGDGATVLHFDGTRWTQQPIGGLQGWRPNLHAVLPFANDRVVVVGERTILELRLGAGG